MLCMIHGFARGRLIRLGVYGSMEVTLDDVKKRGFPYLGVLVPGGH